MSNQSKAYRPVSRAASHIEEAMGWLNEAAQQEPGAASEFYQATYDLNRVLVRIQYAVESLN